MKIDLLGSYADHKAGVGDFFCLQQAEINFLSKDPIFSILDKNPSGHC